MPDQNSLKSQLFHITKSILIFGTILTAFFYFWARSMVEMADDVFPEIEVATDRNLLLYFSKYRALEDIWPEKYAALQINFQQEERDRAEPIWPISSKSLTEFDAEIQQLLYQAPDEANKKIIQHWNALLLEMEQNVDTISCALYRKSSEIRYMTLINSDHVDDYYADKTAFYTAIFQTAKTVSEEQPARTMDNNADWLQFNTKVQNIFPNEASRFFVTEHRNAPNLCPGARKYNQLILEQPNKEGKLLRSSTVSALFSMAQ